MARRIGRVRCVGFDGEVKSVKVKGESATVVYRGVDCCPHGFNRAARGVWMKGDGVIGRCKDATGPLIPGFNRAARGMVAAQWIASGLRRWV